MKHNPKVVTTGQGPPVTPHQGELENISYLKGGLYRRFPPHGKAIPTPVQPADIPYGTAEGEGIAVSVQGLCTGQEGGPSGMKEEHLKGWLRGGACEK